MNRINAFLEKRSKREIWLLKFLWITLCFFICFEYFIYPSFLDFKLSSKTPSSNHQEILDYHAQLSSKALDPNKILELVQSQSLSLSQDKSLSFKGKIQKEKFFPLLHSLASPSLLITSFSLNHKGDFTLKVKPQNLLSPSSLPSSSLEEVQKRFAYPIPYTPIFYAPQKKNPKLILQAVFNQKAKINGKWLERGEKIEGCELQKTTLRDAILFCNSHIIKLKIQGFSQ